MKQIPQAAVEPSLYTVAGVLVMSRPEEQAPVRQQLSALPGVELGGDDGQGRLVVTIEELPGEQILSETFDRIQRLPGVLSAALVYSRSEQADSERECGSDE